MTQESSSQGNHHSRQRPLRVLVVEDERAIRQVYTVGMQDRGYFVESADNGRLALQTLMQQSFDALVVDLKMHGMDGIVFLQEALKIWPWLSVVIVSGYVTDSAVKQASQLGVSRILQKPVDLSTLCEALEEEAGAGRQEELRIPINNALALMRDHLKLLTEIGDTAMETETLVDALLEFSKSLAAMLPADVVGIMVLEGDERVLLLTPVTEVQPAYLDELQQEMMTRYQTLSGRNLPDNYLKIRIEGEETSDAGPASLGTSVSVPVILGQEVCGLLTLAATPEKAYTPADVSLLYHAANHVSAVFMAIRKMHRLATQDPLTGVYNRIRLEEELERSWLLTRRYETSMGVVVVDIDQFKTVNDAYGHDVGDQVLRELTGIMEGAARASDIIARYGGDEFVAILPQAREPDAYAFSERLLKQTREHVFCKSTHELHLTISVGIATSLNPTKPATSAELLSQADRALFMAKRAGRNRICVWPHHSPASVEVTEDEALPQMPAPEVTNLPRRVMVVDDEGAVRNLVKLMLEKDHYQVDDFSMATDAVEALKANPGKYDVMLTDLGLPKKSGIDLLHEAGSIDPDLIKVVMTGYATVDNAVNSLREGAYDFIHKPISRAQLSALIARALEYRDLKTEQVRYQSHLEEVVRRRSAQLANSLEAIRKSYDFTLEALVAMLDAREHQTGKHSLRTRELTLTLARQLGLNAEQLEVVSRGALLHDIGKIAIPDSVLLRPGPLTPEEWTIMKRHPEIGYRILSSSPYLKDAADIVWQHQEDYDGTGYPRGLKGDEICIGARLFHVIDAYDAMRSPRVYREPMSEKEAVLEIRRNSGTQFDPEIVDAFLECERELEAILASPEEPDEE